MWSHAAWPGRHLPQPLPPRDRLRAYATWCNAVEGNTTFYATPSRETAASWAAQAPESFRFVLKLPRQITHDQRLSDTGPVLRDFLASVEPLGPRIHALWIQLPPVFGPGDLGALAAFLRGLPADRRYAVEVRHRAFFLDPRWTQSLEQVLDQARAEWIGFDTTVLFAAEPTSDAEREAWAKKPRLPRRTRALTGAPVVRYLGRDDSEQTAAGWQPWLDVVVAWLREGRSPTVFIHTPGNEDAPVLARRFHDEVRARVPDLAPLPVPVTMPAAVIQPTLF